MCYDYCFKNTLCKTRAMLKKCFIGVATCFLFVIAEYFVKPCCFRQIRGLFGMGISCENWQHSQR